MTNMLHHFVPQFYLRRFVANDGQIWVYDKDADKIFHTSPKNIAAERGFYTLDQIFPDPVELEKQFNGIEQEAAKITDDWLNHLNIEKPIVISGTNRRDMSLYITTQLLRTAEARTILLQGIRNPDVQSMDEKFQREIHIDLLWNLPVVDKICDWVHSCIWTFRFCKGPESLYTSDDPVKLRTSTKHLHWGQIPALGAYALFPLTPTILMYCFEKTHWEKLSSLEGCLLSKPLESELVRNANIHQVGHAQRFVFSSSNEFSLARQFCLQHSGVVGSDRKRFSS